MDSQCGVGVGGSEDSEERPKHRASSQKAPSARAGAVYVHRERPQGPATCWGAERRMIKDDGQFPQLLGWFGTESTSSALSLLFPGEEHPAPVPEGDLGIITSVECGRDTVPNSERPESFLGQQDHRQRGLALTKGN